MATKPSCEVCRELHDSYGKGEPNCKTCITELMPCNEDAATLWNIVRGQVVTAGMGQVVDINHLAVWAAIDRYEVDEPVSCFEKIVNLFRHFLELQRIESEG